MTSAIESKTFTVPPKTANSSSSTKRIDEAPEGAYPVQSCVVWLVDKMVGMTIDDSCCDILIIRDT